MPHGMTSSGLPANVQHNFARVPNISKPRSTFDRSKPYKSTITAGYWTPVFLDEVLPGDTFALDASIFARLLSPLSVPIMDNLYMDWIAIYCPNRLVWEHFINQMGEQATPTSSIDYLTPVVTVPVDGFTVGSLADYFGLPVAVGGAGSSDPLVVSALPFRMYNLFINQWVIAQNVVTGPVINVGDGPDPYSDYALFNRMRRPDYFTSCQTNTQKGSPAQIPISGSGPVVTSGAPIEFQDQSGDSGHLFYAPNSQFTSTLPTGPFAGQFNFIGDQGNAAGGDGGWSNGGDEVSFKTGDVADLVVNFTGGNFTINELRLSATIQQYLELDERGGTRYPEFVHNHFGVQSSDARLQRVEFLAAGTIPILTHVVPQTTPVISGSTPQANLAAFTSASGRAGFTHSFEEHGHVMVLVEIRADVTYQQGLNKMWTRQTRFDYYDPIFANIGEQPVLNQEIYAQGNNNDAGVFGYQEYAAEYRFGFGQVTGLMRAGVADTVSVYNLALFYGSLPTLSTSFLVDDPPISRVSAVEDEPLFIFDSFWKVHCTRVMPTFSIPGLTRI